MSGTALVTCDRCSQGVTAGGANTTNDHWLRLCPCECHTRQPELSWTPTWVLEARVAAWVDEDRPVDA